MMIQGHVSRNVEAVLRSVAAVGCRVVVVTPLGYLPPDDPFAAEPDSRRS
jgi:hypothetical protein